MTLKYISTCQYKNNMSKFYAVKARRKPGIYNSCAECQKQTKGFSGAVFKSFKKYEDAKNFITPVNTKVTNTKIINIYTDGSHQPFKNNYLGAGAYCDYGGTEYRFSINCDEEYLKIYGIENTKYSNPTAEFLGYAEVLRYFIGVYVTLIHVELVS